MSEEVCFKPIRHCPVCHKFHDVKYQYRGIDILVCPQMKEARMVLMHEEYATDELERLKGMSVISTYEV